VSIVEQTMRQARRSVAAALIGVAVIGGGLMLERLWYSAAHIEAARRHALAQQLAGDVRLAMHRLNHAAQMAVVTGEPRWVQEYDSHLPALGAAVTAAKALATPAEASRFDLQTRQAGEELLGLHESAIEAVNVGAVDAARKIFDGEQYRHHTGLLNTATAEFTAATVASTQDRIDTLNLWAAGVGATVVAGSLLTGMLLWRRLAGGLARSRRHFLDAEERIQRLASRDLLTGLSNRAALHDAMHRAMSRARRDHQVLAVLMIDLDRFKPINDQHGHMVGDVVLKKVARRLRRCLRGSELMARYGGDEFVVVIHEGSDPFVARVVAERIVRVISQPMCFDHLNVSVGASVGVARYPVDAVDGDELLRKADSALYRAKGEGRARVCFYDSSLDEAVAERSRLEQAMREGITRGQFVPYYQPIVELASARVQSVELLCRWQHPQRGLLAPGEFIALAEESGQIGALMLSVLDQACADMVHFPAHWRLSVNIAPQQIQDDDLVPGLLAVLRRHRVPPRRLDVELTETALVSDTAQARGVMLALKEAGITVTLDDFGTGYSSLCYLAEMSFDKIKIDRSFVHTLLERPQSAKIVDAVLGLSRSLGVQTVAEGVETEAQAQMLRQLGCGLAQGYLYGRPVSAADVVLGPGVEQGALEPA
jgi:diguanylate cyclase (GGDEF)-like protein